MIEIRFIKPLTDDQEADLIGMLGTGNSLPIRFANLIFEEGITVGCRVSPQDEAFVRGWGIENGVLQANSVK